MSKAPNERWNVHQKKKNASHEVLYTEDLKKPELLIAGSCNKLSVRIAHGWECERVNTKVSELQLTQLWVLFSEQIYSAASTTLISLSTLWSANKIQSNIIARYSKPFIL